MRRSHPNRLLMTADTVGGVWSYALELTAALEVFDVEVVLATMGRPPTDEQRRRANTLENLRLVASEYALEWMNDPWGDVDAAGKWLLALQERFTPDLIHLNNFVHGNLSWNVPVMVVGHSCVTSWFAAVRGSRPPQMFDTYRRRVRQGLHGADLVVAPTQTMLNALDRHYGPLPAQMVIPNAVAAEHFVPRKKEAVILSAGRLWDEAKNIAMLLDVAPDLSWPVHVAGDPTHPEGGNLALDSVVHLGKLRREDLAQHMGKASIYVMPARYEPFGLSPLEAAHCGCALVLGDIPSLREVWGEAALYVPPDDRASWCETLQALIADAPRRKALAEAALEHAKRYQPQRMAERYMQAYGELMSSRVEASDTSSLQLDAVAATAAHP